VHVHTFEPEAAFAYGRTLGEVSREKTEDMEAQFQALAGTESRESVPLAVVAVGAGDGIDELFRSLGAAAVVRGGQTMNPSAGEIKQAIEEANGEQTIVLPNNKNIVLAAQQAAAGFDGRVRLVETRSIPQGVAALVAMSPEEDVETNLETMTEAVAAVASGEITLAARSTKIDGIDVEEGQPIALIDDVLVLAGTSVDEAARRCVARMLDGRSGGIVSLYRGDSVEEAEADTLAEALRQAHGCDVEVIAGGQPHYPYLIGVE
jgi:dihydroxyacetone kinase-like predicted kinase